MSKQKTIKLSESVYTKLRSVAESRGESFSEVMDNLLSINGARQCVGCMRSFRIDLVELYDTTADCASKNNVKMIDFETWLSKYIPAMYPDEAQYLLDVLTPMSFLAIKQCRVLLPKSYVEKYAPTYE